MSMVCDILNKLTRGQISHFRTVSDKAIYKKSLDININLVWGLVMLVFGAAMLWLAMRARGKTK